MMSPEELETQAQARAAKNRGELINILAALFCMAWFLSGFIVIGYQIVQWLKTASWVEFPVYIVFNWLEIDLSPISNMRWQGIKVILFRLLDWPLSAMLIVLGCLISWAIIALYDSK